MMLLDARIAEHHIRLSTYSRWAADYIEATFGMLQAVSLKRMPDLSIVIADGYGQSFEDFRVEVTAGKETVQFCRSDYRIVIDRACRTAAVDVYDEFALKHALVHVYSAFITHIGWGLLMHASCMLQDEGAYLFAGHSGAGKSTVARLSEPRTALSDEAAIVRIGGNEMTVFASPFRSDTPCPVTVSHAPLRAVHLLRQAAVNRRQPLQQLAAMTELTQRVFYWAYEPEETKKVLRMIKSLIERVPAYELYFTKDDSFWEEIS